ncbi:diguanylate cyclase [Deinococcus sp. YIM 134068]|uniref:sensor domain-containing diguanylate cyclase n=1 Tax=Deinococcus lichenicola TaxID=3118910 RepID=UPI002F945F66
MPAPAPSPDAERFAALRRSLIPDALPEEAFDRLATLTAQVLGVPSAHVTLTDGARRFRGASHGTQGVACGESLCAHPAPPDEVFVIEDLRADPRFAAHPEVGAGLRMYAGAPLVTPDGQTLGALCVFDTRVRGLDGRERELLRSLARLVADELDLRLTTLELARARDHATTLHDLAELMHAAQHDGLDPAQTAERALTLLHARMRLEWSGLVRLTPDGPDVLHDHTTTRGETFRAVARQQVSLKGSRVWDALTRHEHVFLDDYSVEGSAYPHLIAAGLRSAAWLYLRGGSDGSPYVLALARLDEPAVWTPDERTLLEAAARSVSVALDRAAHVRSLERAALTDPLTGLGNRRALDEALDEAGHQHAEAGEGYVLAVVDLDGMKRVNDERGHASGDDLLRAFADALRTHGVRAYRPGGDEYTLLHVAPPDRRAARQALVALVAGAERRVRDLGYPASASVGVAAVPDDAPDATTALRTADSRMYAQKRAHLPAREGREE